MSSGRLAVTVGVSLAGTLSASVAATSAKPDSLRKAKAPLSNNSAALSEMTAMASSVTGRCGLSSILRGGLGDRSSAERESPAGASRERAMTSMGAGLALMVIAAELPSLSSKASGAMLRIEGSLAGTVTVKTSFSKP